jgi:hypothetical protein
VLPIGFEIGSPMELESDRHLIEVRDFSSDKAITMATRDGSSSAVSRCRSRERTARTVNIVLVRYECVAWMIQTSVFQDDSAAGSPPTSAIARNP